MKKKLTTEEERQEILRQYRHLIEAWTTRKETKDQWDVRKAFRMAAEAHKDMRRKSGEPYIMHPLAVATIVAGEMGLGRTSIISALLHDTVEDTEITLEDVEKIFGPKVARIIDGLTKIDEISGNNTPQSATLKKIIFTLSDDVRVILVKLADRLHNMRTMDVMPRNKQLRISSETLYIYAPLAYRLGFFAVKSELEDLSFKFSQPELYQEIKQEIIGAREQQTVYLNHFMAPIRRSLEKKNLKFELLINEKTTYSVWQKMRRLELPFDQIYNTFSLDIIVDTETENESLECWAVYSELVQIYKPNNKQLREWMSTPKANGYEAIHTTVMGPQGKWVAVHIRSRRMQEIAQKGYAAYLKYKTRSSLPGNLDIWLKKTRELLMENDNEDEESINFLNEFKQDLFSDEIYVFTPKGDMVTLPKGATVLDFAYAIHSDLGNRAIGANLNRRVVTIDSKLRSGDQVEIITSKISQPQEDWYNIVVTARAKTKIKTALKNKRKLYKQEGEKKLQEIFQQLKVEFNGQNVQKVMKGSPVDSPIDFYYMLATGKIGKENVKQILQPAEDKSRWLGTWHLPFINKQPKSVPPDKDKPGNPSQTESSGIQSEYIVSSCCYPVPGDNVIVLELPSGRTEVHRTDCEKAIQLMSVYGRNILKSKWKPEEGKTYLAKINITAKDRRGLLNAIAETISLTYQLDMNAINMRSHEGLVFIDMQIFVPGLAVLKKLMASLAKVDQVLKVVRVF